MTRRFLAFDIETAAVLSDAQFKNWKRNRPLGITCIAAQKSDETAAKIWDARLADGGTSGRMTTAQVIEVITYLRDMAGQGYTLLTWNGAGFDWDILAEESGSVDICRELAMSHVDMMFHIVCERGHAVSLEKAAQGHGIRGKPPGMAGFLAPLKWADGHYQEVLDYVAQDVRIALELAIKSESQRSFRWVTSKGSTGTMPLPRGWLNVASARQLPEPDTSWMSNPISRAHYTEWLSGTAVR